MAVRTITPLIHTTLAAIDDKIDDLSESVAKDYALKSDLNDATDRISTLETNTYTKDECNKKFVLDSDFQLELNAINTSINAHTSGVLQNMKTTLMNYYNKTDCDNKFALKSDVNLLEDGVRDANNQLTTIGLEFSNYYNKQASDGRYMLKTDNKDVDLSNYYTKTQSDSRYLVDIANKEAYMYLEERELYRNGNNYIGFAGKMGEWFVVNGTLNGKSFTEIDTVFGDYNME